MNAIKSSVLPALAGLLSLLTSNGLALEATMTLQAGGMNVIQYDIDSDVPNPIAADLIVTADEAMRLASAHLEHLQHAAAGTILSVVTGIDPANGWSAASTYSGPLAPKSTSTTAATGGSGASSGRYATVSITIDASAAQAAYLANQRTHTIRPANVSVLDTSFEAGTITSVTGLTIQLISSANQAFTYQGRLVKDGQPVTAACDCTFSLWDDPAAGTQVGSTLLFTGFSAIEITGGFFTVELDFGVNTFDGDGRWLQVDVQCPPDGSPTTLLPRQKLTPTPYALVAQTVGSVPWESITAIPAGFADGVDNWDARGIHGNVVANATATVGGGEFNTASSHRTTVGGGQANTASGDRSTIGGGHTNTASGSISTVGGGGSNTASNSLTTIGGGQLNMASGGSSTIGGGIQNTASGGWSIVGGGIFNTAGGLASTVPGGHSNQAEGVYSLAAGRQAKANHPGTFVWADSNNNAPSGADFASTGNDQFLIRAQGGVGIGTSNPQGHLHVQGDSERLIVAESSSTSGLRYGVRSEIASQGGYGLFGWTTSATGETYGVAGQSSSNEGRGVFGYASSTTGSTYGISGESASTSGRGVSGLASASTGAAYGVQGQSQSSSGRGVFGLASSPTGTTYGVRGQVNSPSGYAGYFTGGRNYFEGPVGIGATPSSLQKLIVSSENKAIHAQTSATSSLDPAIYGFVTSQTGSASGVRGKTNSPSGAGIHGESGSGGGYAGLFWGPVYINNRLGVGVSDPLFRLDLPNTASQDGRGRANRWDTYSSIRWKNNVRPIDDALGKLLRLTGVAFDWNPESGGSPDIGFVAEDVGKVLPDIVSWEDGGEHAESLAYDRITALAVEAIKEQQRQIETLRREKNRQLEALQADNVEKDARIAGQKNQIADLTARLERIESALAGRALVAD